MSMKILDFTRNINELMKSHLSPETSTLDKLCELLAECLNASATILNHEGRLLAEKRYVETAFHFNTKQTDSSRYIDSRLNDQFLNIVEATENTNLDNFYIKNAVQTDLKKYVATIFPLLASYTRIGTFIFLKEEAEFSLEDLCIAEIANVVATLIISHFQSQKDAEEARKLSIVKSALGTLSYSELDAIIHIFEELGGSEGLLIASKIADRVGITRSVIVNALRKFESAGVIETRSLGMKGTYIKILNLSLLTELNKLNT